MHGFKRDEGCALSLQELRPVATLAEQWLRQGREPGTVSFSDTGFPNPLGRLKTTANSTASWERTVSGLMQGTMNMNVSTIAQINVTRKGGAVARYQRRAPSTLPEQGAGQTTRSESRRPSQRWTKSRRAWADNEPGRRFVKRETDTQKPELSPAEKTLSNQAYIYLPGAGCFPSWNGGKV